LAGALVAFALLTLGVQLSQTKPPPIRANLSLALMIRLVGGPCTAALLVPVFGFSGDTAAVLILGAAAPTAVNTALIAYEFKADARFATASVFYTTLFSAISATVLLLILRSG
ncbi:MAG: AEC family transporter, partial [Verrucomicrobiota bacterium]